MKKYIISWDAGYGANKEVIEAEYLEEAQEEAYEQWREEVERNADYYAIEWTEEEAYEHDLLSPAELEDYEKKHFND